MAKVIWTNRAIGHLKKIRQYIGKDSDENAIRFLAALMDYVEKILTRFPEAGGVSRRTPRRVERVLVYQEYVIGYYVRGDACYIAAVIHGHRKSRWTN